MTSALLSLFGYTTRSVVDREAQARNALSLVERAMRGEVERRIVEDMPVVGTASRAVTYRHLGPKGGRAVAVRTMIKDIDAATSLLLARNALESLISPSWSRSDREHAEATAIALALLASDRHPEGTIYAGFIRSPLGPARSEYAENGTPTKWSTSPIDDCIVAETLEGLLVDLEKPRDHGRTPVTVTLSQVRCTLRKGHAMSMGPMDRLRYAQLARRA